MTNLTMHIVRRYTDEDGIRRDAYTSTDLPNRAPHRINARANVAFRIGLDYIKGLQNTDTDVVAVTISSTRANRGRMALASWRYMPTMSTLGRVVFTGTHELHPLIEQAMRGESFGQYLNRRLETA